MRNSWLTESFSLLILILGTTFASAADLQAMDFTAFDQSNAGWRSLERPIDQARALDAYRARHAKDLNDSERELLAWHAGQAYAMAGRNDQAIARFRLASHAITPVEDVMGWNAYVRGSIAFLERDSKVLRDAIRELKNAREPSATNLRILESFAAHPRAAYAEAYSSR